MKLKYQNKRKINHKFSGFSSDIIGWWFNTTLNMWEYEPEFGNGYNYSSHQKCKSIKAFKRKLKNVPCNVKFILDSRYVGFDVVGMKKELFDVPVFKQEQATLKSSNDVRLIDSISKLNGKYKGE